MNWRLQPKHGSSHDCGKNACSNSKCNRRLGLVVFTDGTVNEASQVRVAGEADGPVTPPLDHFQGAAAAGDRDSDAATVVYPSGLSAEEVRTLPSPHHLLPPAHMLLCRMLISCAGLYSPTICAPAPRGVSGSICSHITCICTLGCVGVYAFTSLCSSSYHKHMITGPESIEAQ